MKKLRIFAFPRVHLNKKPRMGKGNVNKAAQKRERNAAKAEGGQAHSILKTKDQAMTIKCKVCMTSFMGK